MTGVSPSRSREELDAARLEAAMRQAAAADALDAQRRLLEEDEARAAAAEAQIEGGKKLRSEANARLAAAQAELTDLESGTGSLNAVACAINGKVSQMKKTNAAAARPTVSPL